MMTDLTLAQSMKLWREHGGDSHGPRVEHVSMKQSDFLGFCRALIGLAQEWQPIETAPKVVDETVLLRIEHINFAVATGGDKRRWEEVVTAYWTDFNGGGWVWHGLAGTPTHWAQIQPLPPSPNQEQSQ